MLDEAPVRLHNFRVQTPILNSSHCIKCGHKLGKRMLYISWMSSMPTSEEESCYQFFVTELSTPDSALRTVSEENCGTVQRKHPAAVPTVITERASRVRLTDLHRSAVGMKLLRTK